MSRVAEGETHTSWLFMLDWGVVVLTLASAGTSALAALIAYNHEDTSAMAEAGLACAAAFGAAWLGRTASRAAKRWRAELVAWHGNDIVLLLDAQRRIIDANDRAVEAYGRSIDSLVLLDVAELRHPEAPDRIEAHLDDLEQNGRALFESLQLRADGTAFPGEVSARTVRIGGRRLYHLIIRDVTEAHRSRARLVAAERLAAVGSVAAGMAHDINSPLCGVLGNLSFAAEALCDERPDLPEVRQALGEARDAASRVRDLVRDLNAFANGFGEGDGPADLGAAIDAAVRANASLTADRCGVEIDLPLHAAVAAPPRRLAQLFSAILRAAALAMPEGKPSRHTIRIRGHRREPQRLEVEVIDDGPPIHPPDEPAATDPFAGQVRFGRSGGAGLAAVIGMVRAIGGDVLSESIPGHGNVVRVLLPAVTDDADPSSRVREEPRARRDDGRSPRNEPPRARIGSEEKHRSN